MPPISRPMKTWIRYMLRKPLWAVLPGGHLVDLVFSSPPRSRAMKLENRDKWRSRREPMAMPSWSSAFGGVADGVQGRPGICYASRRPPSISSLVESISPMPLALSAT